MADAQCCSQSTTNWVRFILYPRCRAKHIRKCFISRVAAGHVWFIRVDPQPAKARTRNIQQLQERLRRPVQLLPSPVHNSHRPDQSRRSQRHRYQPTLFRFRMHRALRQNAHARTQCHSFFNHLDIVELHRNIHFHARIPQEPVDMPPDTQVVVERDEILPVQILWRHADLPGQRMIQRRRPSP